MPTGYTAKLMEDGQDFETFVLTCARAIGACIMLRDNDMSELPTEENVSGTSYYIEATEKAQAELENLQSMTAAAQLELGDNHRKGEIQRIEESIERHKAQDRRLDEMEARVREWKPPTTDHHSLKTFMLEQIQISRNGNSNYLTEGLARLQQSSGADYASERMAQLRNDIEYYRRKASEEKERNAGRVEWVRQLRQSLDVS